MPIDPMKRLVNTPWLKNMAADRRLSQREIATRMGKDRSAITRLFNGERGARPEEVAALAEIFHVPMDQVLSALGVEVPVMGAGEVPVTGWVDAAGDVHEVRSGGPKTVTPPPGLGGDCVALRFRVPGPMDGWIAFYKPGHAQEADCLGRACVVHLAGSSLVVKVLSRGYEPNSWNLTPFGPDGQAFENVRIKGATPILWFRT